MTQDGAYEVGDRVQVAHDHHWAQGATGVVARPPADVLMTSGQDWPREITTPTGLVISFYWIQFDVPQDDAEGFGPFDGAEIDARFLLRAASEDADESHDVS